MTESDHSEEVERVVETHSQQQQLSGLGERPSEARDQETDAQMRELMSLSGIGWPMSDADEHEEQQQQQRGTGRWWTDSWWWTGSRWGSYSE